MDDVPIARFRRHVPDFLKYALSHGGRSIAQVEQDSARQIPGDGPQLRYRDMQVWHRRTHLIEHLAQEMKISARYWGPGRKSADFYNIVDQEIAKLRNKGVIVDWNGAGRAGIFRLASQDQAVARPAMGLGDAQHAPPAHDAEGDALKRTFISILTKGRKDNTYKFALARALLEHCRDTPYGGGGSSAYNVPYSWLAGRFLEYYWHQECRFRIKQDFKTKSTPKVIQAIRGVFAGGRHAGFDRVDEDSKERARQKILKTVFGHAKSKTSLVVPKFQKVMSGNYAQEKKVFYDYDDDSKMIRLRPEAFEFFKNNNGILSMAVLAEWAKFLERINGSLPRLVAKIEQDEAKKGSLAEFKKTYLAHTDHCFYCRGRLEDRHIHVDHFLPWSYIFEDEAWNLVLACQQCNLKKSDSLPQEDWQHELIRRNSKYRGRIPVLERSIRIIDTRLGWKREIQNHYTNCYEYGFGVVKMP